MRFAWLRKNSPDPVVVKQGCTNPLALIRTAYNIAFWFFLLPFFTVIDYWTGFVVYALIIFVRLGFNLYVNYAITQPEEYERFPFRLP